MATNLGTDFHCISSVDANLTPVSGRVCLAQAVARRLISPLGSLFHDPNYGEDLRRYLGGSVATARRVAASAENEAEREERVERADATATLSGDQLAVDVRIEDADGEFDFTLSVSALTAEILTQ